MMVKAIDKQPHKPNRKIALTPVEVFYEFDGPQLFTTQFGFIDAIVVRLDELISGFDFWLCAASDDAELQLIKSNQLSVRAAFTKERTWIIATDTLFNVKQFWPCEYHELSDDILPMPGQSLSGKDRVPDTIEQAKSYFSVGFRGGEVRSGLMPFSTLKGLIDTAYDVSRKILGPQLLRGSKSATYDFMVEPQIGSLIISIERPILNSVRINKKLAEQGLTVDDVEDVITEQRDEFISAISTLVRDASRGEIDGRISENVRQGLSEIKYVIPDIESAYGSVEFSALSSEGVKTVVVDRVVGGRIRRAFERSIAAKSERTGVVVEINSESGTFIIKSRGGRLTTCIIPAAFFDRLQEEDALEIGVVVKVAGTFERRQRRDRIVATSYPEMLT